MKANKIKSITSLAVILAVGLGSLAMSQAQPASETRDVDSFDRIVIEGAMEIYITVGKTQSILIELENEDYLDRVETTVRQGRLTIEQKGRRWRKQNLTVTITVRNLTSFVVEGAANAEIRNIDSEEFKLEINGAAEIYLQGTCGVTEIEINGAGDIDAEEFLCREVDISINGTGDADVYASESIRAELNGLGQIKVYGGPSYVRPTINGFGRFEVVD